MHTRVLPLFPARPLTQGKLDLDTSPTTPSFPNCFSPHHCDVIHVSFFSTPDWTKILILLRLEACASPPGPSLQAFRFGPLTPQGGRLSPDFKEEIPQELGLEAFLAQMSCALFLSYFLLPQDSRGFLPHLGWLTLLFRKAASQSTWEYLKTLEKSRFQWIYIAQIINLPRHRYF